MRWVVKTPRALDALKLTSTTSIAQDARERAVLLFENAWSIRLSLIHICHVRHPSRSRVMWLPFPV